MMSPKGEMPMMKWMRKMTENTEDFNPMEMCKGMMSSVAKVTEMSFYSTPEVCAMFDDWMTNVEKEIFDYIKKEGKIHLKNIADNFGISESAAKFFLNHLAAAGKINAEFAEESKDSNDTSKSQTSES